MAKIYLRQGEDIERALKRFGSLVTKEGLHKELKRREYYLSPSQKKRAKRKCERIGWRNAKWVTACIQNLMSWV